jgi:replicative DNA helicase Mcm
MAVVEDTRDLTDRFQEFYRTYYQEEIAQLAQSYPRERRSLELAWSDVYEYDADLADDYLERPDEVQEIAEEALRTYDLPVDVQLTRAHVRLRDLPSITEIRDVRAEHVNTMIAVRGIVRKATGVRPKVERAAFECRRCGAHIEVDQAEGEFREPHECESCERQGPFRLQTEESSFIDAQTLRIQESPEGLRGGETPESIDVYIEDDLCGEVAPGDRVVVSGALRLDQEGENQSPVFDVYIEGQSIEIEDEEFEEMELTADEEERIRELAAEPDVYEQLVGSIAPSIWGYEQEKLAMLLQLFAGVTKQLPDGSRVRGDIHILLIGDPGTGKSAMLQYIKDIAPRSVYTSGKGSSAAGLTAAAVRDEFADGQQWSLEAGALVLADRGVAAVDELDKMAPDDRSAMHEALEQQSISISKAGINATLKSRCSLLGAANPRDGRFDHTLHFGEQIELDPALISRFDLIFTVTDEPDKTRDERLATHILQSNYAGELGARTAATNRDDDGRAQQAAEDNEPTVDPDLLRKFIAYARSHCHPVLTDEARQKISDFYVDLRSQGTGENSAIPITARKLEAAVRLAEASAKVRLSADVTEADAQRAIDIIKKSMEDIGIDPETGEFDVDVIETGVSQSQRSRVREVRTLIAELEEEHEGGVPRDEVIEVATEAGHERSKVEHELQKMRQRGEIFEPETGKIKTT